MASVGHSMTENVFVKWLRKFVAQVKPTATRPVILFLDNHKSHITYNVIMTARSHHVELCGFPPNTTSPEKLSMKANRGWAKEAKKRHPVTKRTPKLPQPTASAPLAAPTAVAPKEAIKPTQKRRFASTHYDDTDLHRPYKVRTRTGLVEGE